MRTLLIRLVSLALLLGIMNNVVMLDAAEKEGDVEATAKQFFEAFTAGDVKKMETHFDDQILFDGDSKFLGRSPQEEPAKLTKQQLLAAYTKLFERVGSEKWEQAFKKCKPTLTEAAADGKPIKVVKKGDYVYDLHFREAIKGQRAGLDEAVIFVFRKVDNQYLIVGHYADY